ncbi:MULTISPECIES: AsmA family protein [unclassified Mucilaginibacter]|uniref:AsmA family protein n=1 Tax=unclassified Mucilaginibacter TaxID=2617802 RepID=UPI002AC8D3FD|nr:MULTISPECIES: AsmA family protein [unclassified Mucilaginibacter]MEB0261732.1 AsmA family protein [Mucilaginibacter sp. 10I4]MEB0277598.1 AsmA family protein [Mucilaginibacter sp. 10B2]MEB0299513.1 AsmA family protein [Mucilaginibacter sp. 5C4]WPX24773.1 AsmA family protein [Mucilaginibacter sp. 5C4]
MPKWLKLSLKIFAGLVLLVVLILVGTTLYITFNKAKVLKMVNEQLDKSVDGTLVIGDIKPNFFRGFPEVSLTLQNVVIRDKQYDRHKHTLLNAKDFNVSINTVALFKGTIDINYIDIRNAAIDLFTDSTGYSNTAVFKKDHKQVKDNPSESSSSTQLKRFTLNNVTFTVDDRKANKLFNFGVNDLRGKMQYPDSGWRADFHLDVLAKSMAFDSRRGSFIKNQKLEGDFVAGYNEKSGKVNVSVLPLNIGETPFKINAVFATKDKPSANFAINIVADQILWRRASGLLAPNITMVLNRFDISKPMDVTCNIAGSFGGGDGGPKLYVTAKVKDSKITVPGGELDNCSFNGIFTNNYVKDKGYGDDNSAIKLIGMKGTYKHLPFNIDTGSIINLIKPIATGNFRSNFPAADLNYLLEDNVAKFANGEADMKLYYTADVVNYKINKPIIKGSIVLRNTNIHYIPRNLKLTNSSISLKFVGDDLILNNIRLQSGRSIVTMEGRIRNFLNLYYNSPEKILLTWQIRSPQLYLGEFLGFLAQRTQAPATKSRANSGNIVDQLSNVLEKGKAEMHMKVAKVYYKKFLATDATADLLTTDNGVIIQNIGVKHAGGFLKMNGKMMQGKSLNNFAVNTVVSNVNMREFFDAFNNFGLKDFTAENLKGFLSAKTSITGGITDAGNLVPNSINGNLDLSLRNAALIDFKPLVSVGKFAFPFRNLKNISIPKLDGHFLVKGNMITIKPLQISSSVLNADVEGVYGLTKGTDIALDVPLRNPGKDSTITDKEELAKKRFQGIVLHVRAHEEGGKMKIGWNKNHK